MSNNEHEQCNTLLTNNKYNKNSAKHWYGNFEKYM